LWFRRASAAAQDFPKHPITMIVPFAAGGTSDVVARAVTDQMGLAPGQTIVIENTTSCWGRRNRA
jgi:tripartite-type tricarboxylate transporter receptor subunit TctC